MPPTVGQGQIVITANTAGAVAALKQVQNTGQQAASSIATNFTNAARALNSSPLISTAETISALFIQMGGPVARVASVVTSMIRPVAVLGTAFGSLVGPVAALAAPAGGLVAAAFGLNAITSSAVEAADRLEKLGVTIDNRAAVNLHTYTAATDDLSVALDELRVAVGSDVAADLATLASATAGVVRWFTQAREDAREFAETMQTALRIAVDIGTLTLSEHALALIDTAAAANKVADAEERVTQTTLDAEAAQRKMLVTLGLLVSEEDEDRDAKERQRQAAVALRAEEEHAKLVMDARIAAWHASADAADQAADDEVQAILRVRQAQAAAYDAQQAELDAIMLQRQQDSQQSEADAREKAIREKQVYLGLAESAIGSIQSITDTALIGYEQRIAAGEELRAKDARNANAALAAYEVAAIGQAGISSALAGINAFASLTAIELNPFTAAATATAMSLASFTAAVYSIHAHKPFDYQPVRHAGGYGSDPDYDPDDVYGHTPGSDNGDPRADKPRDLPGSSRASRGRGRREPLVRVEIVRNSSGNGKIRR